MRISKQILAAKNENPSITMSLDDYIRTLDMLDNNSKVSMDFINNNV